MGNALAADTMPLLVTMVDVHNPRAHDKFYFSNISCGGVSTKVIGRSQTLSVEVGLDTILSVIVYECPEPIFTPETACYVGMMRIPVDRLAERYSSGIFQQWFNLDTASDPRAPAGDSAKLASNFEQAYYDAVADVYRPKICLSVIGTAFEVDGNSRGAFNIFVGEGVKTQAGPDLKALIASHKQQAAYIDALHEELRRLSLPTYRPLGSSAIGAPLGTHTASAKLLTSSPRHLTSSAPWFASFAYGSESAKDLGAAAAVGRWLPSSTALPPTSGRAAPASPRVGARALSPTPVVGSFNAVFGSAPPSPRTTSALMPSMTLDAPVMPPMEPIETPKVAALSGTPWLPASSRSTSPGNAASRTSSPPCSSELIPAPPQLVPSPTGGGFPGGAGAPPRQRSASPGFGVPPPSARPARPLSPARVRRESTSPVASVPSLPASLSPPASAPRALSPSLAMPASAPRALSPSLAPSPLASSAARVLSPSPARTLSPPASAAGVLSPALVRTPSPPAPAARALSPPPPACAAPPTVSRGVALPVASAAAGRSVSPPGLAAAALSPPGSVMTPMSPPGSVMAPAGSMVAQRRPAQVTTFESLDTNGDGVVDRSEFMTAWAQGKMQMTPTGTLLSPRPQQAAAVPVSSNLVPLKLG